MKKGGVKSRNASFKFAIPDFKNLQDAKKYISEFAKKYEESVKKNHCFDFMQKMKENNFKKQREKEEKTALSCYKHALKKIRHAAQVSNKKC